MVTERNKKGNLKTKEKYSYNNNWKQSSKWIKIKSNCIATVCRGSKTIKTLRAHTHTFNVKCIAHVDRGTRGICGRTKRFSFGQLARSRSILSRRDHKLNNVSVIVIDQTEFDGNNVGDDIRLMLQNELYDRKLWSLFILIEKRWHSIEVKLRQ